MFQRIGAGNNRWRQGIRKEFTEERAHLCVNGFTAQLRCEVSRSAAALGSDTFRLRSGSRSVICSGGSGRWLIKESIDSIPPSVRCMPHKAEHRCTGAAAAREGLDNCLSRNRHQDRDMSLKHS